MIEHAAGGGFNAPLADYVLRDQGFADVRDGLALLGEQQRFGDNSVLVKIGVTNDHRRRLEELNAGIPPAAIGKWTIGLVSEPYTRRDLAEAAEQAFKNVAEKELRSLGGEFFIGDWTSANIIFANVPGVSRFGR